MGFSVILRYLIILGLVLQYIQCSAYLQFYIPYLWSFIAFCVRSRAIEELNGKVVAGRNLRVNEAKPRNF